MILSKQNALFYAPILDSLKKTFKRFPNREVSGFPNCFALNKGFYHTNLNNKELEFVEQNDDMPYSELGYEQRIFQHGVIATRKNNWHDFFNAMVWHIFPITKKAINAVHHKESQMQESSTRSRKRDLLTLFDESGVIIIADQNTIESIRNHEWQTVFVENKNSWINGDIEIITFGHALYEKYLNPYIGMTAHALFLEKRSLDIDFFLGQVILEEKILNSKAELSPLPLLGIPIWHNNQDMAFYANKQYFR